VQGVHIVRKVCVDRGETTSGKLKRDNIEPSSTEVQGVHRKELCLEFMEDRTTEGSGSSAKRASSECIECTRELYFEFREKKCRGETLTELLNTL
jgi:hypothetical protein